jgi:hypothetical protein
MCIVGEAIVSGRGMIAASESEAEASLAEAQGRIAAAKEKASPIVIPA